MSTSGWMALIGTWSLSTVPAWGRLGVGHAAGFTPPFSAEVRDRTVIEAAGAWTLAPARVSVQVEGWRRDAWPDGAVYGGPGDITLGVEADLWRGVGAVWLTKLPNAEDEAGLGTDETDITLLGRLQHQTPAGLSLAGWAGVVVMGDPTRYLSQDTAAVTWAAVGWQEVACLRVGGRWAAAHSGAEMEAALSGRQVLSPRLALGVESRVALGTPGWGARGWLEVRARQK